MTAPDPVPAGELLADLDRDWGDLYDIGGGGGWWWAALRAGRRHVLQARCPRELRAVIGEDHAARAGRRVP